MYNIIMNNPQDTFKNIRSLLSNGMGKDLPSNENKLPKLLTNFINIAVFASLVVGTIYLIKLFI